MTDETLTNPWNYAIGGSIGDTYLRDKAGDAVKSLLGGVGVKIILLFIGVVLIFLSVKAILKV